MHSVLPYCCSANSRTGRKFELSLLKQSTAPQLQVKKRRAGNKKILAMFPNGETAEGVQFSNGVYCGNHLQGTPIVPWSNFRQHRTPARGTQDVDDQVETVSVSRSQIQKANCF